VARYRAAGRWRDDTLSDRLDAHARGASVFAGYLNDPEATRARGSLRSGFGYKLLLILIACQKPWTERGMPRE
jgi:hypothetical protein